MDPNPGVLHTPRLELWPIRLEHAEAVLQGARREHVEKLVGAAMPWTWPTRLLVEQVFHASLEDVRADPAWRLWGDRFIVARQGSEAQVIGSVIFHGRPGPDGLAEIGYGIEDSFQNKGFATEALGACVTWALEQPECWTVHAETSPWHKPSKRVLEKIGLSVVGERETSSGKMLVYERRRG